MRREPVPIPALLNPASKAPGLVLQKCPSHTFIRARAKPPHWLFITGTSVFPVLPRLSSLGSTHITVARGTTMSESLVGMPRVKASRESHRSLDPREGKPENAATVREEIARACSHSRRGLTPLGRLQKYSQDPCQHWRGILRFRHGLHTRS